MILFVVDTRTAPPRWTKRSSGFVTSTSVICVANKTDAREMDAQPTSSIALAARFQVSAQQDRGRSDLLEEIYQRLPPITETKRLPNR